VLAAIGGVAWIVVVVASVFFGKRIDEAAPGAEIAARAKGPPAIATYGSATEIRIPGTAVLVTVFFTAFVLYYFVNWKYLSDVWPLR
jgi:cytochrome c oxidase subunit 1